MPTPELVAPESTRAVGEAASVPPHNGAEILIQLLAAQGVEYVFLNPGTDTAPLQEALVALRADGLRVPEIVPCLYENVALAAAHGYFAVTHRPQVVAVHVDVGTQNLGGNLHNAQRGRAGVVILAGRAPYTVDGEVPGGRDLAIHWQQDQLDQTGIVRNYVKWSHELGRTDTLHQLVPRAFQVAAAEPAGPVYLTVAREVLMERVPRDLSGTQARCPAPVTPAPDSRAVDTLAAWLAEAEAPLAIVGTLGRHPEAVAELVALAELLGLPVAVTRGPMNYPSSHPLYLGLESRQALEASDCVLLLDVDVPWVPRVARPAAGARIAQIDIDPVKASIPQWGFPVDLSIQADTAKALPQLRVALERLATPDTRARWDRRRAAIAARRDERERQLEAAAQRSQVPRPMDVEWVAAALARAIPSEAVVLEEATTSAEAIRRHLRRDVPGTLLGSGGPGLGWALGAAVGAKLALPDRDVIVLCGDGAFIFGSPIAALWAAHQMRTPYLTVIVDNGGYRASKEPVVSLFPVGASVRANEFPGVRFTDPPDYALLARACHAYGERVEDPDELAAALERALHVVRAGTSAVVDVVVGAI